MADEPLALDAVKANLRVDVVDDDGLIQDLIVTARDYVEGETGLVLVPRIVTETAREFGRWIDLASWPVTSIVAVRYPAAGIMTTLAPAAYQVSLARRPIRVMPTAWAWGGIVFSSRAATLPIEIDVQAGYPTPVDVPMRAKQAMHLLIAHWYDNRAAVEAGVRAAAVEIPFGVGRLLDQLRMRRV